MKNRLQGDMERTREILQRLITMTLTDARERIRFRNSRCRLAEILKLRILMTKQDWLTLLGERWSSFDKIGTHAAELKRFFQPVTHREMMTDEEYEFLSSLPETFTIWRGAHRPQNVDGLSWSLNPDTAKIFPFLDKYRFCGEPVLVEKLAHKARVIAVKLDGDESEVICHPDGIVNITPITDAELTALAEKHIEKHKEAARARNKVRLRALGLIDPNNIEAGSSEAT